MSKADELIAGLATAAQFDSAGGFSLDREKARQKMRQFQLADPHRYVLLLVEAAVLFGATTIEFELDTDDTRMRFDAALELADLDELYTSLFVDRTSVEIRARRELALACNAVMALNPRWVRIDSHPGTGDGVAGVRAQLRPEQPDVIEAVTQPNRGAPWTEIHVKERFRPGLLVRFLHSIGDALHEAELLRDRCSFASVSVSLNGRKLSTGLPSGLVASVGVEGPGLRGVAGINGQGLERSVLVLLSNGVEISSTDLGDSVPGLWFWVDSTNFRKDVSQAAVVRNDPGYEAMLAAVAKARDEVLGKLVDLWAAGRFNSDIGLPAAAVFELLRSCFLRWGDAKWLDPNAGPLGRLADLPLWRTVDQRWLSPRMLLAEADPERGVTYTDVDFQGIVPLGWGPVVHVLDGEAEISALTRVYGEVVQDATASLTREVPWEQNRRRWLTRTHPPELPQGVESRANGPRVQIESGLFVGQVVGRVGERSEVRLITGGCLLGELEFDVGGIGISAVVAGPFEPARDYTGVVADNELAEAALLVLAQLPTLVARPQGHTSTSLRHTLVTLAHRGFPATWLQAWGFEAKRARELLGARVVPSPLPEFWLSGGGPTPIAALLTFTTIDGREVSVVELDVERQQRERERGKVLFVHENAPASSALPELIVHGSGGDRDLLVRIFGASRIYDDTAAYRRERARRGFLAQPRVVPSVAATWSTEVSSADADGVHGVVGIDGAVLRDWQSNNLRKAAVELIVEGRRLTTCEESVWIPGVSASLVWEQAPVNASWDGLDGSRKVLDLAPIHDALTEGIVAILEDQARVAIARVTRAPDDERRLLWKAMVAPFLSTEHAGAWRRICAELEPEAAVDAYIALLALFPGVPLSDLRESLGLLLEADRLPTRAAVLELLGRADEFEPGGRAWRFHRMVLERYALFEQVPLLELCSGEPSTLDELRHAYTDTGEIDHVEDRSLHYESEGFLIVRADPIDHVALLRLFPPEHFKEVSAWVHERRHQERFETQAPLSKIRVLPRNRLVSVEFEHEGITGELAIPPWIPSNRGVMNLVFCHQRRVVEELELHASLPVVGIIDDPKAALSSDFRSVEVQSSRMAVVRKLLDDVLADRLLPALADAYPKLAAQERGIAEAWIFEHWRRSSPRAGQYPSRRSGAGERFAALPLFVDVDKTPRTLAELSERYATERKIWYADSSNGHGVTPQIPVLHCRHHELPRLQQLFDHCEDFTPRWRAMVEGERRRQTALPLPSAVAPTSALVSTEVDRHGLVGALWLPDRVPFDSGVILGARGKLLTARDLIPMLPVQGVVDGVPTDEGFERPELRAPEARYLDAQVINVYGQLLNQHRNDMAQAERPDFRQGNAVRLRTIRMNLLTRAAVGLAQARRRGVGFDAILGNLVRRLEVEPLLELSSGRRISVEVASKARPFELTHLGIWEPGQPELDPHVRARLLLGEDLPAIEADAVQDEPEPAAREQVGAVSDPPASEPVPEPAPAPEPVQLPVPEPEPEPEPEPDPVGVALERIRTELRLLRERGEIVLTEGQLDCIRADIGEGRKLVEIVDGVLFDSAHPRFERALIDPDPIWISFLASVAYTALNRWLDEVTDTDELVFHHHHAVHLLSGLLGEA